MPMTKEESRPPTESVCDAGGKPTRRSPANIPQSIVRNTQRTVWREIANGERKTRMQRGPLRRWAENNKDRVNERARKYRLADPEKFNARRKRTYQKYRIAYRLRERVKRAILKQKLVDSMGGVCADCGFSKYLEAMDPPPQRRQGTRRRCVLNCTSWERLWKEASKCVLVCSNCHKHRHFEATTARLTKG